MNATAVPALSHFGIFVENVDAMADFYMKVFGMRLTDRGVGRNFKYELRFLSGSPTQHHQLVLAGGRAPGTPSSVMQMSFKVQSLDELRRVRKLALQHGASALRGMNHGNALSIYFSDPENNTVEVYMDTPWYVPQPHGDPLDLEQSDAEIWAETERICRADPNFMPVEEWAAKWRQ
ncbi:MAG TPA: VOC family protein [Steroidobacteraceae bacterium]|nr:VOC family protein [Steroidobacteraceae bacterium]